MSMQSRMRMFLAAAAAAVLAVLAGCGGGGGGGDSKGPATHALGGTVSGLTGSGLVLRNGAGEELAVTADGAFTFTARLAEGTSYAVVVATQPTGQTCSVANGSGTIGAADVTDVAVTCAGPAPAPRYTVGGTVGGLKGTGLVLQNSGGDDLAVAANGSFTFATTVGSGAAYAVTVKSTPAAQTCAVANGSGTVASANVTNVAVTCADIPANSYPIGGTVSGLAAGKSVVLRNAGANTTIGANGAYTLSAAVARGAAYAVTVQTQPAGQNCVVANASGTMGTAPVTNVNVTCTTTTTAIQAWAAPTTWGARWADSATMLQHAYFDGTTIVETKGVQWALKGTPAPAQRSLGAFTAARFGAGPFGAARYEATAGDSALDLNGNMLVCAIVKPDYNPVTEGTDPVIIAKGFDQNQVDLKSGWVLIQRHHMFNFQYVYKDGAGNGFTRMAYSPTYFADESKRGYGPLNPSYMVVCAGRDGDAIRLMVNSIEGVTTPDTIGTAQAPLFVASPSVPLTIGGYSNGSADHGYGGRIYETAIWNEAATPAKMQEKIAEVLGLQGGVTYFRNREAPFIGPDGKLHTAGRSAPRFYAPSDSGGGLLFGLQGWNRVTQQYTPAASDASQQNPVVALGEDLANALWTKSAAAATTAGALEPPGDSERRTAARVQLPHGESLSTTLGAFDGAGPIHAMMWIQPFTASGTLRVATGASSFHDVDLSKLPTGKWTYVWLSGLTTAGTGGATLTLSNPAASGNAIDFYAWGLDLTQIGRGADLGAFDPGPVMYDWGGDYGDGTSALDVLRLPTVPASTDATGFCMTVDAQPAAGLPWNAVFQNDRALLTWVANTGNGAVNLFFGGSANTAVRAGDLCAYISTLDTSTCWTPNWAPGSKHTIGVCSTATGDLTLYGDGAPVGAPITSTTKPPDLGGGHVLVGNNRTSGSPGAAWQGFISRVAICPAGDVSACR